METAHPIAVKYNLTTEDQSEFFNKLLSSGDDVDILIKKSWKKFKLIFNPASCALEAHVNDDESKPLLMYITLRECKPNIAQGSDGHRITIKTPNQIFTLRLKTPKHRSQWLCWTQMMVAESSILSPHLERPENDNDRPAWWIPHDFASFCGCCVKKFSPTTRRRTCRLCGLIYCSRKDCFDDKVKKCQGCLGDDPASSNRRDLLTDDMYDNDTLTQANTVHSTPLASTKTSRRNSVDENSLSPRCETILEEDDSGDNTNCQLNDNTSLPISPNFVPDSTTTFNIPADLPNNDNIDSTPMKRKAAVLPGDRGVISPIVDTMSFKFENIETNIVPPTNTKTNEKIENENLDNTNTNNITTTTNTNPEKVIRKYVPPPPIDRKKKKSDYKDTEVPEIKTETIEDVYTELLDTDTPPEKLLYLKQEKEARTKLLIKLNDNSSRIDKIYGSIVFLLVAIWLYWNLYQQDGSS